MNTNDALEIGAAVLATTTTIAVAIRAAIPMLTKLAEHTATRADDDFLVRLGPKLDWVIGALDVVRRMLPRVVVGPLPSTQPIASAMGRATNPSMQPISAPPPPRTTLKPWPAPEVSAPSMSVQPIVNSEGAIVGTRNEPPPEPITVPDGKPEEPHR